MTPFEVAEILADSSETFLFLDGARHPHGDSKSYIFCDPTSVLTGAGADFRLDGVLTDDPVGTLLDLKPGGRCARAGFLGFEFAWELDAIATPRRSSRFPDLWVALFESWGSYDHATSSWIRPLEYNLNGSGTVSRTGVTLGDVRLTVSEQSYRNRVEAARRAIFEGEVFEVNYTERFEATLEAGAWELYCELRSRSTGGNFAFLKTPDFAIASVSPEAFLSIVNRHVITRPIKGTRRSYTDPERDRRAVEELLQSEKDRAENVMIVDLMRNDLTRFCEPGTVRMTELCAVETFAGVHHLVSTVEGHCSKDVDPLEAMLSAFPPGSITGAPKLRAIEAIAGLEHSARGPYTGSMFFDVPGQLESNVLIRTACVRDGLVEYGAGGAVVWDSSPESEYQEAVTKAQTLLDLGAK